MRHTASMARWASLHSDLIDETPSPRFAGLHRLDHRMLRRVKVLRGVAVLRLITTADMAAVHAAPQMDPCVAHLQALFASARVGRRVFGGSQVLAYRLHASTLQQGAVVRRRALGVRASTTPKRPAPNARHFFCFCNSSKPAAACCTSSGKSSISCTWRTSMVSFSPPGQRAAHATASSFELTLIIQ
jgi:hypothetical protein